MFKNIEATEAPIDHNIDRQIIEKIGAYAHSQAAAIARAEAGDIA